MKVLVKKLHELARVPSFARFGDAGADLHAVEAFELRPLEPTMVKLGIAIELPYGYEAQIRPRSSLSKRGVVCSLGTIDSGYRGELAAILTWYTDTAKYLVPGVQKLSFNAGDRVAQLVICELPTTVFEEAEELSESERGYGGFGSTGV